MKKILLSGTLVLSLLFSTAPQGMAATFSDLPTNSEQQKAITKLANMKIINGYSDGTFKPQKNITRAQVAKMIASAVDLPERRSPKWFKDVPEDHPNHAYIQALYQAGIIDGAGDHFNPGKALTRGQMAKILANTFALPLQTTTVFNDVSLTNGYNTFIGAMVKSRITTGYEDGTFRPNQTLSRAHFAVFMNRALFEEERPTAPTPKPEPKPGNPNDGEYIIPGAPTMFKNCTEMRKYYPNGLKRGHPAYADKHDRDQDGWACERN